ncbi:hypothetical protein PRUB_b0481 [Pseudoalteromonas rubra]|uniref:Uncharacterized protein n=1 Tax=Pseudoalteromonas rubra TaxID=43658 RepID=A0A8T0C1V7_9GAMM|nr:hypothetical protein PRUB_b0481 [Pseudoalteromonas rubra]
MQGFIHIAQVENKYKTKMIHMVVSDCSGQIFPHPLYRY